MTIEVIAVPPTIINILVIDKGQHGQNILDVINNKAQPTTITEEDLLYKEEVLFDLHKNINVHITESYDDFNPNNVIADIINQSSSVLGWNNAMDNYEQFLDKIKFPSFPLVISSAGNGTNTCTQFAYDFAKTNGGISFHDDIEPFFECSAAEETCPQEALDLYKACDIGSAYVINETEHKKDWIIVGANFDFGQKPGPILKDRWISTYYSFDINGVQADGTSYSVPYVVKIAAEIKRRAPHYTNDQIAQLIFSTADDIGEPGVDEIYGNGRLNPKTLFDELKERGF